MSKVLIWDLPTRVIHWLLTIGFVASFGIAIGAGEHSALFPVHMMLGIAVGLVAIIRVVWGIVGARYARFSSFVYSPAELWSYVKAAVTSRAPRYAGHNPGSAYATYAILALAIAVAGTGLLMSTGVEAAEELHVPAAWALALVAAIHIVGVGWHSWRHRENLALTMVTGWKRARAADGVPSDRPFAAAAIVLLVAGVTFGLFRNYDRDRAETRLPVVNTVIHLGEGEHH